MATISQLSRRNPCFDPDCLFRNELLYTGGRTFQENISLFLQERSGTESPEYFDWRCGTGFDPIFANVLDHVVNLLFSVQLSIVPAASDKDTSTMGIQWSPEQKEYYQKFQADCDHNGTSLHDFEKAAFCNALKLDGCSYTLVDFPRPSDLQLQAIQSKTMSLKEQEDSGLLQGYLCAIPNSELIDWECDDKGNFIWIRREQDKPFRPDPLAEPLHYLEYTAIKLEDGVAKWEVYQTEMLPANQEFDKSDDKNDLQPAFAVSTTVPEIPIASLHLSAGLALGPLLGPLVEQLFEVDSQIYAATGRGVVTVPYISAKKGQIPAAGQEINFLNADMSRLQNPAHAQRQNGWLLLGDDQPGILETKGDSIKILLEFRDSLQERIYAAAHQLAQNVKSSKEAISAAAKEEDKKETEIMLTEMRLAVEKHVTKIFHILTAVRDEDTILEVKGLNTNDQIDRDKVMEEAISFAQLPFQSEIFKANFLYEHAIALVPGLSEEDSQEMRIQLQDNLDKLPSITDDKDPDALPTKDDRNQEADRQLQATQPDKPMGGVGSPSGAQTSNPSQPNASQSPDQTSAAPQPTAPNKDGKLAANPTAHLRATSSTSGIGDTVYNQLVADYDPKLLGWVKAASWSGPAEVPLELIDDSNRDAWAATDRTDKIKDMGEKMQEGWAKPIILVNEPNDSKYRLIDGHTRFLAKESIGGDTINAFIAQVGSMGGDWEVMHDLQKSGEKGGNRSNQKEVSQQKDAS